MRYETKIHFIDSIVISINVIIHGCLFDMASTWNSKNIFADFLVYWFSSLVDFRDITNVGSILLLYIFN